MYMSYCRFEGTWHELRAAMGTVDEHLEETAEFAVSDKEIQCFKSMVEEFTDWLRDTEICSEVEINWNELDNVCKKMAECMEDEG